VLPNPGPERPGEDLAKGGGGLQIQPSSELDEAVPWHVLFTGRPRALAPGTQHLELDPTGEVGEALGKAEGF